MSYQVCRWSRPFSNFLAKRFPIWLIGISSRCYVETFSWNLCVTALRNMFQQALHRVTWSVSFWTFVARQVSPKVEPLFTSATVATIAVVTKTRISTCNSGLRNDDSNDNATNQWFDWLNKEKISCCTCGMLFGTIFWRSLPSEEVNFIIFEVLTKTRTCGSKSFILCLYVKTIRA